MASDLLQRFIAELEGQWSPINKGRLISRKSYERAWQVVERAVKEHRHSYKDREAEIEKLKAKNAELTAKVSELQSDLDLL